jgi:hypothetical protein
MLLLLYLPGTRKRVKERFSNSLNTDGFEEALLYSFLAPEGLTNKSNTAS